MRRIWMVRAGRESRYVDDFIRGGVVGVGWTEVGEIARGTTKSEVKQQYRRANASASDAQVRNAANQLFRFLNEFNVGDGVVTYDRDRGRFYLGKIISEPIWAPQDFAELPRIRRVKWEQLVARDRLSPESRNSLGSIQTLFQVKTEVANDLYKNALPLDEPTEAR